MNVVTQPEAKAGSATQLPLVPYSIDAHGIALVQIGRAHV